MFELRSFNKRVPVVEGPVFEVIGIGSIGIALFLENQDSANTMVYHFESSSDGVTWDSMSLPISGGGTSINFAILPGETHLIKLTSTDPRVRLAAHGDLICGIGLAGYKSTATGTQSFSILE